MERIHAVDTIVLNNRVGRERGRRSQLQFLARTRRVITGQALEERTQVNRIRKGIQNVIARGRKRQRGGELKWINHFGHHRIVDIIAAIVILTSSVVVTMAVAIAITILIAIVHKSSLLRKTTDIDFLVVLNVRLIFEDYSVSQTIGESRRRSQMRHLGRVTLAAAPGPSYPAITTCTASPH